MPQTHQQTYLYQGHGKVLKKKDYDVSNIITFLLRIETLIMINLAKTLTEIISKSRPLLRTAFMVAELGFEPRQTESESVVLPLHNSAVIIAASSIISQKNVMSTTFCDKLRLEHDNTVLGYTLIN